MQKLPNQAEKEPSHRVFALLVNKFYYHRSRKDQKDLCTKGWMLFVSTQTKVESCPVCRLVRACVAGAGRQYCLSAPDLFCFRKSNKIKSTETGGGGQRQTASSNQFQFPIFHATSPVPRVVLKVQSSQLTSFLKWIAIFDPQSHAHKMTLGSQPQAVAPNTTRLMLILLFFF